MSDDDMDLMQVPVYSDSRAQQLQALEGLIRAAGDVEGDGPQKAALEAVQAAVRLICGASEGNIREIKKRT